MFMWLARLVIVALLTLATSLSASTPINADGPNQQPPRQPLSPRLQVLGQLKAQVAAEYAAHKRAGGTPQEFAQRSAELGLALNGGKPLPSRTNASAGAPGTDAYSESRRLYPGWQLQINDWYCGPAAGWVAMNWLGAPNNHFGAAMNQPNLGTWYWLETDTYTATPLGENWRKTLNGWVDGTNAGFYLVAWSPSATQVADFTSYDIDSNYIPILDIQMSQTNGYLHFGYQAYGVVQHYVAGSGYSSWGSSINYIDPWGAVQPGERVASASSFSSMMRSHGMVW